MDSVTMAVRDIVRAQPAMDLASTGEALWRTQDGRVLPVRNMTTEHRANVVRMLVPQVRRWLCTQSLQVGWSAERVQGDLAEEWLMEYAEALMRMDAGLVLARTPLGKALYADLIPVKV